MRPTSDPQSTQSKRVFRVMIVLRLNAPMLQMTAVGSTTGNYYGALRDVASDGTAETDIPDPLPEGYLHHLPSEVLAIVLHYLTTAARIPFCDAGDRLRLTRMTRRLVL